MISFQSGEGLTLNELLSWEHQGYPFYRTAHIGNLNLSTILLGKLGFPILLHEDIPGDFPGYRPAYIRLHGQDTLLFTDPSLNAPYLTTPDWSHTPLLRHSARFNFTQFQNALALHSNAIRQIVPAALTWSSFLQQNRLFVSTCLATLCNEAPEHIFLAYIDTEGHRYKFENYANSLFIFQRNGHVITLGHADAVQLYLAYIDHLHSASSSAENIDRIAGLLLSVPLNIVLTLVTPVPHKPNSAATYFHFCGERMFDYLLNDLHEARDNQDLISKLYAVLAPPTSHLIADPSIILIPTTNIAARARSLVLSPFEISQYDLILNDSVVTATQAALSNCMDTRLFNST